MGLDATVPIRVKRLKEHYPELYEMSKNPDFYIDPNDNSVGTRIGTYGALHCLRDFYRMVYEDLNGKPPDENMVHLLNHSDADGYYVADDFVVPIQHQIDPDKKSMFGWLSIGSSQRLLAELEGLKPYIEMLPSLEEFPVSQSEMEARCAMDFDVVKSVFDKMYFLAKVSTESGYPIMFH